MRLEYENLDQCLRRIAARNEELAVRRVTKVILTEDEKKELLCSTRLTGKRFLEGEKQVGWVGTAYGLNIYVEGDDA